MGWRRRTNLTVLLFLITLIVVIGTIVRLHGPDSTVPPGAKVFRQSIGAYGVPREDLNRARDLGLNVALSGYGSPNTGRGELEAAGMKLIARDFWGTIKKGVPGSCKQSLEPCVISHEVKSTILRDVRAYLKGISGDPTVIGLYILDDYPGNIVGLLEDVHREIRLVAEELSLPQWPTVCGFGGNLDRRLPGTATFFEESTGFPRSLRNYSPRACDAVLLYIYARRMPEPPDVDWTMAALLPRVKSALHAKGWNSETQPLLGTPQAFGYPEAGRLPPQPKHLASQIVAFCEAGAVGIIPYAWADTASGPKVLLANDPGLRGGLADGIATCREVWRPR